MLTNVTVGDTLGSRASRKPSDGEEITQLVKGENIEQKFQRRVWPLSTGTEAQAKSPCDRLPSRTKHRDKHQRFSEHPKTPCIMVVLQEAPSP